MFQFQGPHKKESPMKPEDQRNLFIFLIIAALSYFAYDAFVLQPQAEALRQYQLTHKNIEKTQGAASARTTAPETILTREEALRKSQGRASLENKALKSTLALKGAKFDDLALSEYFKAIDKKEPVTLLNPEGMKYFKTVEYGWISDDKTLRLPDADTLWQVDFGLTKPQALVLFWDNGQGLRFERTILLDDHYMFTVTDRVTNNAGKPVTLYPYGLIVQKGVPEHYTNVWVSYEGPVGYIGEELLQLGYAGLRKEQKKTVSAQKGWIGITDKYWLTSLIPPQNETVKYSYTFSGDVKDKDNKGFYQADYLGTARDVAIGASATVTSHLYVGAKQVQLLERYETQLGIPNFDLSVDFGWFWFMSKPFFFALHALGAWTGNMGAAIILLTLIIRGSVFPLTNISYRSFAKMKKVGPQITALREQYGDDKVKLQQELMKMYEKEGVNPISGCFPILLQIPIFFALYKTFYVSIELRQAPFFGWIQDLTAPDPTSIFNLFGLIPWEPPLHIGVWPCLMLVGMILQRHLNPPPQDALQRDMANYMPFLFAYMMSNFASGLVIYWTFSAYIGITQQIIIMKSLNVPIHLFGETKKEAALNALIDKGPDVHPLEAMATQQVEHALFGGETPDTPAPADDTPAISRPRPKKSKKKKS